MDSASWNNLDESPTSADLLDSCHFSQVVFTDLAKFFVPGVDVICHYNLSQHITPRKKDWVGIFRVGWKATREYYTFMWAPVPSSPNSSKQQVLFKAYYLPKDDEYYQFCYVDQDGLVRGASVPFQFRAEAEDDMLVVTTQGEVEEIEEQNATLVQENQKLKENITRLQKQNADLQEKLKAAEDLQQKVEALKSSNEELNLEVTDLKKESIQLEILFGSTEAELQELKEENKNVLSKNDHLEDELKAALDSRDQLQLQLQSQQNEVENLQEANQDKARHLEQLEEENRQLNAILFRQENYADLDKELKEKRLLLQTLQKEKDKMRTEIQRLRQKNGELAEQLKPYSRAGVLMQPAKSVSLLFGNPYSVSPEPPETDLESIKKCPMCDEVFPSDIGEQQYSDHVQSHLLECPFCNETFDKSNEQVYEDHIYCHHLVKQD